jgi:prophage regulatory protein
MTPPLPPTDQLLTVHCLMKLLKVSERTIWRYVAEGKLPPPIRLTSRCTRWRKSDVDQALAKAQAQKN